ncbi:MAG: hypothetical protein NVSMB53_09940 [Gemmatimonadaceae bacterium]
MTLIWSGPRTSGTGGSFEFGGGRGAGTSGGTITGTGVGAEGRAGVHDTAATTTQQVKTLYVKTFIIKILVASAVSYESPEYAWVVPSLDAFHYLCRTWEASCSRDRYSTLLSSQN